jgi:hypothetical protein
MCNNFSEVQKHPGFEVVTAMTEEYGLGCNAMAFGRRYRCFGGMYLLHLRAQRLRIAYLYMISYSDD